MERALSESKWFPMVWAGRNKQRDFDRDHARYFAIANTKKKKLVADFVTTYLG